MIKQINLFENEIFDYEFKKFRNSRRFRLSVYPGGRVLITGPTRSTIEGAERFLKSKKYWLREALSNIGSQPLPVNLKNNPEDYKKNYKEDKLYISDLVKRYNKIYNFKVGRISIRNQKTMWGSCSAAGNLSFNYRLFKLPEYLAGYIVVHELCHLAELNHSVRFWELVAKTVPRHKQIRKQLNKLDLNIS